MPCSIFFNQKQNYQNIVLNRKLYMKIISPTFLLFLLSILTFISSTATISIIDQNYPFRSGSIYVYFPNTEPSFGTLTITYHHILSQIPFGIAVSPRSIETSSINNYVDYNFFINSKTTTGFTIDITLSKVHPINYTKVIVDFFTNIPLPRQVIYTRIPNDTATIVKNNPTIKYDWNFLHQSDIKPEQMYIAIHVFVPELIVDFAGGRVEVIRYKVAQSATRTYIGYSFNNNSIITSIKACVMLFDIYYLNGNDYNFLFFDIYITQGSELENELGEEYVYSTMFIGISGTNKVTNKVGFYFGFPSQTSNSALQYKQANQKQYIYKTQQSVTTIKYNAISAHYSKKACSISGNPTYIYLQNNTQLCYQQCPLGKYHNSAKYCLKCRKCTNKNNCLLCYTNGCIEGSYFDTSILPFKCTLCPSACSSCFANSTGGPYCTGCITDEYYIAPSKQCRECSQKHNNCQTCTIDGSVCLSCLVDSKTELVGLNCQSCNDTSYYNYNDRKCYSCEESMEYCEQCNYVAGEVVCMLCSSIDEAELVGNQCLLCNSSAFYNSTTSSCFSCSGDIPFCSECSYSLLSSLICTACSITDQKELLVDSNECVSCNSSSFYNNTSFRCRLCSDFIEDCGECDYDMGEVACNECSVSKQLVNNQCGECNSSSFFNQSTIICQSCSNYIPYCNQCSKDINNLLSCEHCDTALRYFQNNSQCIQCPLTSYLDLTSLICTACHPYCLSCSSPTTCSSCLSTPSLPHLLFNSTCVPCNPNSTYFHSPLPFCTSPLANCTLSTYNPLTKRCQFSSVIQNIFSVYTTIASIPTINIVYTKISYIVGFLDDISYYNYHKRNYSYSSQLFFQEAFNFTLMKFIPLQLVEIYQKIFFSYKDQVLMDSVKIPKKFEVNDQRIYFLTTTEEVQIDNLLTSVVTFSILMVMRLIMNKYVEIDMLTRYQFIGMFFVSFFSYNLQYLSFRCFAQLHQLLPLGLFYYVNLMVCYLLLLFIIVFAASSIYLFQTLYPSLSFSFILNNLFNHEWTIWFFLSSLIKIVTGFIHSFFYYYPVPQSILLTLVIFLRAILFSFVISYTTNMMDFACQLVNNYLFCVLQFVFMTETLLVELGGWRMDELEGFSSIESVILMVLIIFNFMCLILIPVKGLIEIVSEKVGGLLREMEKRGGKNKGRKGILGDNNNVKILEFWKMEKERQMKRQDESDSQSCSPPLQRSSQIISLNDETKAKKEIRRDEKEQQSLDNFSEIINLEGQHTDNKTEKKLINNINKSPQGVPETR